MKTLNLNTLIALVLTAWLPLAANAAETTDSAAPAPQLLSEALTLEAVKSLEAARADFARQQRQALSLPAERIALPTASTPLSASAPPRIAQTTRPILVAMSVQAML